MPVYEYRCAECGAEHEAILLSGDQAPTSCPDCGGELKRRYGRVGVQLLGWGFSKTDGWVPERSGRQDFKKVRDKAAELFD